MLQSRHSLVCSVVIGVLSFAVSVPRTAAMQSAFSLGTASGGVSGGFIFSGGFNRGSGTLDAALPLTSQREVWQRTDLALDLFLVSVYNHEFYDVYFNCNSTSVLSHLFTLGISQPLAGGGPVALAAEGGFSVSGTTFSHELGGSCSSLGGPATVVSDPQTYSHLSWLGGGYIGGRASLTPARGFSLNAMYRYHTQASGFWQAGGGLTAGMGRGLGLQIDYYHTEGQPFAGVANSSDTVLVGIRLNGDL